MKYLILLSVLMSCAFPLSAQENWQDTAMHMRLVDDLDRPQDGWCIDVVGSGPYIRFDMPLIGHNCKPGLFADEAVQWTDEGQIKFPAFGEACITVMGLNQYALEGSSLMLKECGAEQPFLNAPKFQRFTHTDTGQIKLRESELCLTLGDTAKETFDPSHTLGALSTWQTAQALTRPVPVGFSKGQS